jgi:hypothetical protein
VATGAVWRCSGSRDGLPFPSQETDPVAGRLHVRPNDLIDIQGWQEKQGYCVVSDGRPGSAAQEAQEIRLLTEAAQQEGRGGGAHNP